MRPLVNAWARHIKGYPRCAELSTTGVEKSSQTWTSAGASFAWFVILCKVISAEFSLSVTDFWRCSWLTETISGTMMAITHDESALGAAGVKKVTPLGSFLARLALLAARVRKRHKQGCASGFRCSYPIVACQFGQQVAGPERASHEWIRDFSQAMSPGAMPCLMRSTQ